MRWIYKLDTGYNGPTARMFSIKRARPGVPYTDARLHLQENTMKLVEPILAFQSELRRIRRDLHAHPELCYEEQRTSDVVPPS